MKKIICMLIAIVMIMSVFTGCEYESEEGYDEVRENYTGYYNYARFIGSNEVVEIDSCIHRLDAETGWWMYDITINGRLYSVKYYDVELFVTRPN